MPFRISDASIDVSALDSPSHDERGDTDSRLGMLILLGLVLRIWGLHAQSFTMDEMTELGIAKTGIWGAITAGDGFPPLFNLVLQGWVRFSGGAEAARWLSVILGVLAIPVIYRLGKQLAGRRVGLLSALLLAISPIHIWYSQEIRAYPLYILLALLTLWRYGMARRTDSTRDWALYALVALAGLYTHYYFGFVLLALAAIDVVNVVRRGPWGRVLVAHLAIAVLAIPMLLMLRSDLRAQMNWPDQTRPLDLNALAYTLLSFFGGYSLGPSLRELHTIPASVAVREVLPWALAGGLATGFLFYRGLVSVSIRPRWIRVAMLIAIPIVLCGVLGTALDVGYRIRYVAWGIGPFVVLLAMGLLSPGARKSRILAFAVLCVLAAAALAHRRYLGRYANEDARGAAHFMVARLGHSTPVFIVSDYMAVPVDYYLKGTRRLQPLSRAQMLVSLEPVLDTIRREVPAGAHFWLLYSRPFDGDPGGRLKKALDRLAGLQLRSEVPGIEIYEGVGW